MPPAGSAPYRDRNVLERVSTPATLQFHYRYLESREREILRRRLSIRGGTVLSVGCGWRPGRHLFPASRFRLVAVDANPECVLSVRSDGSADQALVGYAGDLDLPGEAFDVVLYRFVLHHVAFHQELDGCFAEAARLLRGGGAMIAIEPGLWHPVGLGLALANRAGLGVALHGTPDDVPLSPRRILGSARRVGLTAELHAVTYAWRRLPVAVQRRLHGLDGVGSRARAASLGHTLMLIARKP